MVSIEPKRKRALESEKIQLFSKYNVGNHVHKTERFLVFQKSFMIQSQSTDAVMTPKAVCI